VSENSSPSRPHDEVVVSLASVIASANQEAQEAGLNEVDELLNLSFRTVEGKNVWEVTYGPHQTFSRRGGGLIVLVDPDDNSIVRVQHGQ